jgi:transcriptional regulator with XRE-family HTH domain
MKEPSLREVSGMSQFSLARQTGISRSRISLWELGELTLSSEEQNRIQHVLLRAIEKRVRELSSVLAAEQRDNANSTS